MKPEDFERVARMTEDEYKMLREYIVDIYGIQGSSCSVARILLEAVDTVFMDPKHIHSFDKIPGCEKPTSNQISVTSELLFTIKKENYKGIYS